LGDPSAVPPGQYYTIANYNMYPYSRGYIHITGPSLTDRPDFEIGMLSDLNDIDLKKHVWAYKKQREIMRRCRFYRGEVAFTHPQFPAGSKAACVQLAEYRDVVEDLEYDAEDDKAIEQCLRANLRTCWHSLGTVKMAPLDKGGCVDGELNVYGVKGLKVVDLSIVPENVGANTNNTAFLVGEKGADIILRGLGLV
jgi:alcohol oxidase